MALENEDIVSHSRTCVFRRTTSFYDPHDQQLIKGKTCHIGMLTVYRVSLTSSTYLHERPTWPPPILCESLEDTDEGAI